MSSSEILRASSYEGESENPSQTFVYPRLRKSKYYTALRPHR